MFGKNKILKPEQHDGRELDVVNIFKTLQGEGPYAGHPAIFIRLGGCNLQCSFCDTEFDQFNKLNLQEILAEIEKNIQQNNIKLIVITGGEPLRQPIELLCKTLIDHNLKVQIETNGTIKRKLPEQVHIVCSPKLTNENYQINDELISYADCFKFLVSHKGKYKQIPKLKTNKPIYVQPIDAYNEKENKANQNYALKAALENGYIFSLQQHKILDIE